MSNGKTHRQIGAIVGGLFAYFRAVQQNAENPLAEAIGGALGGYAGAKLPDIIDPPTHPKHRSIAHGVVPVALAGNAYGKKLAGWQGQFRAKSAEQTSQVEKFLLQVTSGAAAGLPVGYGSHVALDATTPAGLPLLK